MQLNMLKSKIHRAVVVQAELSYVGSITVDKDFNHIDSNNLNYNPPTNPNHV